MTDLGGEEFKTGRSKRETRCSRVLDKDRFEMGR